MIRVLFVCLGNICRSPMAEAVFQHKVRAAGLQEAIEADSAGTGDWHLGKPPHQGTRAVLTANAINYAHRARLFAPEDLQRFDYVLTMDDANLRTVRAFGDGPQHEKIRPFLQYAAGTHIREVPDPYFTGNFEEVYALVDQAADGLLAEIRREHSL